MNNTLAKTLIALMRDVDPVLFDTYAKMWEQLAIANPDLDCDQLTALYNAQYHAIIASLQSLSSGQSNP